MPLAQLASETDFAGWRQAARALRVAGAAPCDVAWAVGQADRFGMEETAADFTPQTTAFAVPKAFIDLAEAAIFHRNPTRFGILYRLLWRLKDEPSLLGSATDEDVAAARHLAREVGRASHRMKAFVRFRLVEDEPQTYAAWYEPPHRVLERTAPFFAARFARQRFSILTPDACAHWDGEAMTFTAGVDRASAVMAWERRE